MSQSVALNDFLKAPGIILDVRSPSEYAQGRIPGAINLPIFTDAERAAVGTTYKQVGKQAAIALGLQIVGPKLADLAATAQQHAKEGYVKVHCWRGGMRSSSAAWLLHTVGLKTITLANGYKAFRRWILEVIKAPRSLHVIGGLTGSGKTDILHALRSSGEQILDLEHLANHRGSTYGMLGMPAQPTNEQFENEIGMQLAVFDSHLPTWIEDESRMIGICKIPDPLFHLMRNSLLFFIERPLSERLSILLNHYGNFDKTVLIAATQRLIKRLGAERTNAICELISKGEPTAAFAMLHQYYDKSYQYGISRRQQPVHYIQGDGLSPAMWAQRLQEAASFLMNA